MAAINCAMLSPAGHPVPLPGEKFLYSSMPATVALSLFARPPGADFSVQPKRGHEYKQAKGTVHVSQKRIVYVSAGPPSTPSPMITGATASGASGSSGHGSGGGGSLATGQASIVRNGADVPPPAAVSPDKVALATLSVPLRYFVDGHLVQPWFGANYYEALCLEGDGTGDLTVRALPRRVSFRCDRMPDPLSCAVAHRPTTPTQGPHILRLYFKEGGSYEFYTAVEEVKARADLHTRRDTPVEELRTALGPALKTKTALVSHRAEVPGVSDLSSPCRSCM